MKESRLVRSLRSLPVWLIPLLAIVVTTLLWLNDTALTRFTDQPQLWLGAITTVVLWILVLVIGAVGLRLRRVTRQLETFRARRDLEDADLEPIDDEDPRRPGFRYMPAWLAVLLGLACAAVIWFYEDSLLAYTDEPRLWVGVAFSAVLGLLVLSNAVNRLAARRARASLRSARRRENLVLETLQSLDVMISASAPDGSRSRFNSCYQAFTGKKEDQLKGRGWLERVHPDDREQCIGTIVNHEARPGEHLELEYTLLNSGGEHRWIREFLVPRFGADGTLLEYIASATDITAYVQNETEHENLAEELRQQTEQFKTENARFLEERDELVSRAAKAEKLAHETQETLAAVNDQLQKAANELKTSKDQRTQLKTENTKLAKSLEQLTQKLADSDNARIRAEEQIGGVRKELQQVSGELKGAIKERETARAESERAGTELAKAERAVQNLKEGEKTLREELEKARGDLKNASKQLADTKAELERAAGIMGKHEQVVESLQVTEKTLREEIEKGQADLQEAKKKHQADKAEFKKMSSSVAGLEKTIEKLKASEQALKDQIDSERDLQEKSKTESTDARRKASQHRAKINRLTARCEELEEQVKSLTAGQGAAAAARPASDDKAAAGKSAAANGHARGLDAELSSELRLSLSSVARINEQLRDSKLDEMQRSFIENAQASVDAMVSLIDEALGRSDGKKKKSDKLNVRAFDIRAAAKGVCDMLAPAAQQRGVGLRCGVDSSVPALVSSDPVQLRQVLMYLLNSAIKLADGGELGLRISAEGITAAHATMRFEIRHPSARVGADQMESTFALNRAAKGAAANDPARLQAAKAWQLISEMKGQFAFEIPEAGGFKIWFTLSLPKLTAAKESAAVKPAPAKAPAKPAEAATVPLAASAPEPAPTRAQPAPAPSAPSAPAAPSGDRMAPRLPQEMLDSNLGPVLELGADSARVQCSRVPKGAVKLEILSGEGRLKLKAEVISSDRMGVRKFSVVLRFTNVTAEQRRQIMQIVFAHRTGATMLPMDSRDND